MTEGHNKRREELREIFAAALAAVAPDAAVTRHVHLAAGGRRLEAGGRSWDLDRGSVRVVGAGKGAAPMAQALENLLGAHIAEGFVVVKYGHHLPLRHMDMAQAAHPVPDAAGVAAARRILEIAHDCAPGDLLICLLTGGASALTAAPAPGLTLGDLQATTNLLLQCGATIHEVNAVRKHLSSLGGGQLAAAANGADVLGIIVSDVVGDALDVIASGPTSPDPSTFAQCLEILDRYHILEQIPAPARERLMAGAAGRIPETPKPGDPLFERVCNVLAATNRQALEAAAAKAGALGMEARILTDSLTGEARDVAADLVAGARQVAATLRPGDRSVCLLAGGETTVTLRGKGLGGRNQEMALAAALALENVPGISGIFAGTDGTDGPTDAAGGFVDAGSVARMGGRKAAQAFLEKNDSNAALVAAGDLLITGPTRTNVMDLAALLVEAPSGPERA
ncbi:MAG: DUF4147 domain-containing protein [Desulfovibrio sp.]|nr:DUF4147 domain-containing protein [Desulfovibrio sp.]